MVGPDPCSTELPFCSLAEVRALLSQPSPGHIKHPLSFLPPSACRKANTRRLYEIHQSSEQHCLKYLPPSRGYKQSRHGKCKTGVKSPIGHRKYKIVYSDWKGLCESKSEPPEVDASDQAIKSLHRGLNQWPHFQIHPEHSAPPGAS